MIKKAIVLLLMVFSVAGLTACPKGEKDQGELKITRTEIELNGKKSVVATVGSDPEVASRTYNPAPIAPPAPGEKEKQKAWLSPEELPQGWPSYLPIPGDAEIIDSLFNPETGTGSLRFTTKTTRGVLVTTYQKNLEEEGFELKAFIPSPGSYLRKFRKGELSVSILIMSQSREPGTEEVEIRISRQEEGESPASPGKEEKAGEED